MNKNKFYKYAHLYLALGLLVVATGFSKTYFSQLNEFSFPYHLHGTSASLWMILLIIQPYLIQKGLLKAHRVLGWSSLLLVPTIVIAGIIMMRLMIQGQANYPPNVVYQLAFIDTLTLLGFTILYLMGLYFRKNLKLHARFMVTTIFGPLVPALTRLFIFNLGVASNFNEGLTYSYFLIEFVLLVIIWKERNYKEINLTYLPFLFFIIAQHILMYFSGNWSWWKALMDAFANYNS
jgi:hypothetical protein